jgi:Tfp pilus assembly protein PilX
MHRALSELVRRLRTIRSEGGYVMVTVMGVLLVATLFSAAAISAAQNDTPSSRGDVDRKAAFAAAEAGLNYYLYRLNEDSNFWASCTNVEGPSATEPAPVNQPWTSGSDNRVWRNVPDSADTQYTIELLPVTGSQCNTADPAGSMINPSTGTFRIRATGRSSAGRNGGWTYRSIVGTFRRRGFLDFLYFTDFETSPPTIYPAAAQSWAASNCNKYVRDGRLTQAAGPGGVTCTNIQFAPGDVNAGPIHTNDQILICGNPTFGRLTDSGGNPVTDAVEVSHNASPGYRNACAGTPNVRPSGNTLKWNTPTLNLPPSNTSLSTIVKPQYTFLGTTTIRLDGSNMTVTDHPNGTAGPPRTQDLLFPSNGVVYVKDNGCSAAAHNAADPYNLPVTCPTAYVSGTYSSSLTISAERDIVVRPLPTDGDNTGLVRSSSGAMLGLIGNDHVRVFHNPQTDGDATCEDTLSNGTKNNIRIDAAILALNYSFMVDYYNCGAPRNLLSVNGAIAQRFRGPVGTGGASGNSTGYVKNYSYDDRLKYRSPPYFLDPVQSAWQIVRYNEQIPAKK